MLEWVLGKRTRKRKPRGRRPSYEEAKSIAEKGDLQARRKLASFT